MESKKEEKTKNKENLSTQNEVPPKKPLTDEERREIEKKRQQDEFL